MRVSHFPLLTMKETPADAEVVSHQLMLRAGLIRKLAAGVYTWLPLGLRVLRKVEAVVREEMNRAGALELSMPAVQPAELWQESGRWQQYGPELLRIKDRHEREFCFGPTHEEVITDAVRTEDTDDVAVSVAKATGDKCARCWIYDPELGGDANFPGACPRCTDARSCSSSPGWASRCCPARWSRRSSRGGRSTSRAS